VSLNTILGWPIPLKVPPVSAVMVKGLDWTKILCVGIRDAILKEEGKSEECFQRWVKLSSTSLYGSWNKFSLSDKWCYWTHQILHNGNVSVMLNNEMVPYFKSVKGVRMSDHTSPTLFNVAAENV
jgi:hypothetical protein